MNIRTRFRFVARSMFVAVLTTGACSHAPESTSSAPAATSGANTVVMPGDDVPGPVTLPNLSQVAAPVRAQIEARDGALRAVLARATASPAERAKAYGDLADILMAATFFDEAQLCYRHAAREEPDEARWTYLLGHATLRKGDRDGAAAAFSRTIALEPAYVPALVWLGDTQLDLGRNDEAQATFASALAQSPGSAAVLFGAGRAALARGAYAEAVSYLEHAQQADPNATAINYPLAMAYRRVGATDRAEPLL
ncbi:MAG: tetratricopeptide repeat protein, partial [Vicinamibacterales bacterium]